jgi:hypothetical protein
MLMSVGIIFLVGTLGLLADASYGYYQKHVASPSTGSAALHAVRTAESDGGSCSASELCGVARSSYQGIMAKYWDIVSQQMSFAFVSDIGLRVGSYSAVWFALVAGAALCMFCTRPTF